MTAASLLCSTFNLITIHSSLFFADFAADYLSLGDRNLTENFLFPLHASCHAMDDIDTVTLH